MRFQKNCAVHYVIINPRGLKVRRYAASMNDLNKYLAVLPGEKTSGIIFKLS